MRKSKIAICVMLILLTVSCIVLPFIGLRGFFTEFRVPYSSQVYLQLLGGQLMGPIFTLLFSALLLMTIHFRKRMAWWIGLISGVGPIYTTMAVGGLSHDFSHTVFKQCSEIYGQFIEWFSISSGVLIIAFCILERINQRRVTLTDFPPNQ